MTEHGGSILRPRWTVCAVIALTVAAPVLAQSPAPAVPIDNPLNLPDVRGILPTAKDAEGVTVTLQILFLMTVLTLVPSILVMTTCFTRVLVVLALLRQAMATPQLPPGQVLLGLSLFITLFVMGPTWSRINQEALQPYLAGEMGQRAAVDTALGHMRQFMFRQIDRNDNHEEIYLFVEYAGGTSIPPDQPLSLADVPTTALIPAFILSELKIAFVMGFRIYLPFLVIDMVIASILISMGMMMLPPVLISLPFKILLFVLADGWHLVIQTVLYSFDNLA
ncbi:MAG: flagellar type III secretion system pore protein FliP [Phycisphaerae bacterium]